MKMIKNIAKIIKLIYTIDKKLLLIELICTLVENIEKMLRILLPAFTIELLTEGYAKYTIFWVIVVISIISMCGLVSKIMRALLSPYALRVSNLVDSKIREKLFRLDYEYSETEEHLEKHNLVRNTFDNFLDIDYLIINDFFGSVLMFLVMSVVIFDVNWFLYIIVLIVAIINYKISHKSAMEIYAIENSKKSAYAKKDYFIELLYNIEAAKEIKLYGADGYIMEQYDIIAEEIEDFDRKIEKNRFSVNIKKHILSFLQRIAIYLQAIHKFATGSLQLGRFYIFVSAGTEFVNSVENIINAMNEIKEVSMYFSDYDEYMNIDERMYSNRFGNESISRIETIEFKNVCFMYNNANENALENINCKIKTGDKIALIGENGAGKTTFIKLLLRLYDPTSGEILVNGKDVRNYNYQEYLKAISSAFQDNKLTGYSVLENIVIDREYNERRLLNMCEISGIKQRIMELENGFESIVSKDLSEEGILFSGGEQQKISITRALYKNEKEIILDEPTSAIDAIAEKTLFENMYNSSKDGLMIYITHRLSNVAFCNNILLFENGKIIESGNHEELIKCNGKYADMFSKQASFYV